MVGIDPSVAQKQPQERSAPTLGPSSATAAETTHPGAVGAITFYDNLKTRLDQLIPNNNVSAEDLRNCETIAPTVWPQIKASLIRQQQVFSRDDFEAERMQVQALSDQQIGVLMRAIARFAVGEQVVEDELQPLIDFYSRGDGVARYRALFVRIQQAEEKVHAEFFKFYKEVVFESSPNEKKTNRIGELKARYLNTDDPHSRPFRRFFDKRLPTILAGMNGAETSKVPSFREIAALSCYHIFAEGVVAESAYFAFEKALKSEDGRLLPTLLRGVEMIKQHETTHIGFGVQRLREIMEGSWLHRTTFKSVFLVNCLANLPTVAGIVRAVHREHPGQFPFPLDRRELAAEGVKQFTRRFKAVMGWSGSSARAQ